ncbi:MAG: type II secretion system protein [Candidatus Muiribacteriaceae bacterium]
MTRKGFSLVELVIALGIVIIMTGAAALYLGDIYFKSQVAKSLGDMETIANSLLLHDTENGADRFETNLPGADAASDWYADKDKLTNLLGNYLAVLPNDPWGNTYRVNSYAGWVRTYNSDFKIGGTSKYEKDISQYYLPENLAIAKVRVSDNNKNLIVDTDDTLTVYFTKSVRCNIDSGAVAGDFDDSVANAARTSGLDGADATGYAEVQDFAVIQPDGTSLDYADIIAGDTEIEGNEAAWWTAGTHMSFNRPNDSSFSDSEFSRRLVCDIASYDGTQVEIDDYWKIGNDIYIPTGQGEGVTANRSEAYCIWESTEGYKTYKTEGEKKMIYLLEQSFDVSKRTIQFKGLID